MARNAALPRYAEPFRRRRRRGLLTLLSWLPVILIGCAGHAPNRTPDPAATPPAAIYVIHRGWHTDVGFSVADLHGPLAALTRDFPGARYLIFGFGDRHYVLARDKNLGEMLAALWPGRGMVLATGLAATPELAFGALDTVRIETSPAQTDAAAAFVWKALHIDGEGVAHPYAPGPYAGSLFYESVTTYAGWHTCNTWTAQALRAGQLPVQTQGVLLSSQVWDQARELAAH